jgi:hypothetical protein
MHTGVQGCLLEIKWVRWVQWAAVGYNLIQHISPNPKQTFLYVAGGQGIENISWQRLRII